MYQKEKSDLLLKVYEVLVGKYGYQNWWPLYYAKDKFLEVSIGAILTQNTSWKNVEKALSNLILDEVLDWDKLKEISEDKLKEYIKPAGFYNQKAKTIKSFVKKFYKAEKDSITRKDLISVKGIGKETADAILLYGLDKTYFVIDAYTKRLFYRLGLIPKNISYDNLQRFVVKNIPENIELYKEFHALIVEHCKSVCKKKPLCDLCPLQENLCSKVL